MVEAEEFDETLAELERYRRDRWIVGAGILVAVIAAFALLFVHDEATNMIPWAALAFLAVAAGYGLIVVREERRAREAVHAVIEERERTAGLVARVVAMESLQHAARGVAATDQLDEVFDRLLAAAHELTFARSGVVLLRVGDSMTVAAGEGPDAPARGDRFSITDGVAGAVVRTGKPLLSGRGSPWGTGIYSSSIAAPLQLPGEHIVGALVVTRGSEAPEFTEADVAAVGLLAEHAALAFRNATRLDAAERDVTDLQAAAEGRAEAVAGIVHDLKSPLTAIGGFTQMLAERGEQLGPDQRASMLRDVRLETSRMRELVDNLMQAATAEAGQVRPTGVVNLADIVRDVARTGRGLVHAQRSPRELRLDASQVVPVVGDASALRRVVANLLDNAIQHTPGGTPIDIVVGCDDRRAYLTIRDRGPGLDETERELAFEPFHRGPDGGSGLGLHVVRSLIAAHGGTARLEPAEGTGLTAVVLLPVARSAANGVAAAGSPARSAPGPATHAGGPTGH